MSERFVASCVQLTATDKLEENLATCRDLAKEAKKARTELLALPECFGYLGTTEADKFVFTEVLDESEPGPILKAVIDIATEHGMWVSAGGIAERLESERTIAAEEVSSAYNAHIVVSPAGRITAKYRKIHLFDVDIPGKATLRESDSTHAGRDVVSSKTDIAKLGLSICYDLRFPEMYRTMALREGAEVLLVPAAFTAHTGEAHWHTLLRARAIENQCYVVAAGQVGRHNHKRESYGHSLIIDPWGRIVAELAEGTGLATAEIDLGKLRDTRRKMPCHTHQTLSFR